MSVFWWGVIAGGVVGFVGCLFTLGRKLALETACAEYVGEYCKSLTVPLEKACADAANSATAEDARGILKEALRGFREKVGKK